MFSSLLLETPYFIFFFRVDLIGIDSFKSKGLQKSLGVLSLVYFVIQTFCALDTFTHP